MNKGRGAHAVGIVTDEVTQEKLIIVTGGFKHYDTDVSSTIEVLVDGVWSIGKIM